jgi:hypothetical protein
VVAAWSAVDRPRARRAGLAWSAPRAEPEAGRRVSQRSSTSPPGRDRRGRDPGELGVLAKRGPPPPRGPTATRQAPRTRRAPRPRARSRAMTRGRHRLGRRGRRRRRRAQTRRPWRAATAGSPRRAPGGRSCVGAGRGCAVASRGGGYGAAGRARGSSRRAPPARSERFGSPGLELRAWRRPASSTAATASLESGALSA